VGVTAGSTEVPGRKPVTRDNNNINNNNNNITVIAVKLDNKHRYDYVTKSAETSNESKFNI
jgi:hypothetical protein